jgi:hypothetical protein
MRASRSSLYRHLMVNKLLIYRDALTMIFGGGGVCAATRRSCGLICCAAHSLRPHRLPTALHRLRYATFPNREDAGSSPAKRGRWREAPEGARKAERSLWVGKSSCCVSGRMSWVPARTRAGGLSPPPSTRPLHHASHGGGGSWSTTAEVIVFRLGRDLLAGFASTLPPRHPRARPEGPCLTGDAEPARQDAPPVSSLLALHDAPSGASRHLPRFAGEDPRLRASRT